MIHVDKAMELVGAPYKRGGDSVVQGFDCYTLVRYVRAAYFGVATPILGIPSSTLTSGQAAALAIYRTLGGRERMPLLWAECDAYPGAVVALGQYRLGRLHHCAVVVNAGVLHALETMGVVWTPLDRLRDLYKRVEFFECLR